MCEPVSIAMGVLAVVGGISSANDQNKAYAATENARRKNNIQLVRQANTQDANLQLQDRSNFEAYRQELENTTMDAVKAQGTVQTAMAESNLEGRSMERVQRDVENVYFRTKGMINENYERDYHNIYVQRASNRDNLIAALEGSQPTIRPNQTSQILNVANQGMQGYMAGANLWGTIQSMPSGASSQMANATASRAAAKTIK